MSKQVIVGLDSISPGESTSASRSLGGMRPYMQDIILGVPALRPDWHFKLFVPDWVEPYRIATSNVSVVRCDCSNSRPKRVWFEQMVLPRLAERENVDIFIGPCNTLPLRVKCRTVLLVQAHQYFTHPETYKFIRRKYLHWAVSNSARVADVIGVNCLDGKRVIMKHVPGLDPDKFVVVNNRLVDLRETDSSDPANDGAALSRMMGRPRPFLFYISALYPFKNHARLIQSFAQIRPDFPDLALALAGGNAGETAENLKRVASECGVANDVLFLGRVPQEDVPVLYRNARAMVMPSLEETFGLPVLEAMAFDCPVLTSNLSSMPEVAGDAAVLIDPYSVDDMAHGLRRILSDGALRADLIERGRRRCALFTKERTVRDVAAALDRVAGRREALAAV